MKQGINNGKGVAVAEQLVQDRSRLGYSCWHWCYDRESSRLLLSDRSHTDHISIDDLPRELSEKDYAAFCVAQAHYERANAEDCHCTLTFITEDGPVSLLFIFMPGKNADVRLVEGVAIPLGHQVSSLGLSFHTLAVLELSRDGLALFDAQGILRWQNTASRELLGMNLRQQRRVIGRYNLMLDSHLCEQVAMRQVLDQVTGTAVGESFVVRYPIRQDGRLPVFHRFRVRLIPIRGNSVQGIFLAHLQQADQHDPLTTIDHLFLSDQALIAVKNQKGFYLSELHSISEYSLPNSIVTGSAGYTDLDRFSPHSAMALRRIGKESLVGQTALAEIMPLALSPQSTEQNYTVLDIPLRVQGKNINLYAQLVSPVPVDAIDSAKGQEVQRLLNAVRAAICYLDAWGVIKEVNFAAKKVFGEQSFKGKHFVEFAPDWDDPAERQREIMYVARTGIAQTNSLESVTRDGCTHWYSVDKVPTRDERGVVTGVLLTLNEVTDQIRQTLNFRDIEARYKAYRANSTDAIWCYDLKPPVAVTLPVDEQAKAIARNAFLSECNDLLLRMMGLQDKKQILGSDLTKVGSKNYIFDIHTFIQNKYQLSDHEIVQNRRRGGKAYRQISCIGVVNGGHLVRVWGVTKDITARKLYEEKLAYQASHDSLTQLPNRDCLYKEMERWLVERKVNQLGALLFIDLDRFKEINNTLGHQVGDQLLQQVGPRLSAELSEVPAIVARLGGDEFAIFLQKIRNPQQATIIAHRVLDALRHEFNLEGFSTEISASVGVAIAPNQAEDVSTLMRYADVAMYRAKKEMCGLSLYSAEHDPHSPKRLAMMGDLGRAIREDQLALYYQPKVNLQTGQCYGVEALIRWFHPVMGLVSPAEFIPVVELTSLINPLTTWVLDRAIGTGPLLARSGPDVYDGGQPFGAQPAG